MKCFRKIWTSDLNNWLLNHKDMNRKKCYKLFVEVFKIEDVTFTAFCNQRSRLGAVNYTNPHGSTLSKPLYSEQTKKDYVRIKVAQPNVWIQKGRWIYEEYNPGYIYQKGDKFIFLDGDNRNFSPANIELIKAHEMTVFNAAGGTVKGDPEATKINLLKARMRVAQLNLGEKLGLTITYGQSKQYRVFESERKAYYRDVEKKRRKSPEYVEKHRVYAKKRYWEIKNNHPEEYEKRKEAHRKWYHKKYKQRKKEKKENE